ncbi:hypothetical protein NKG05_21270 [Oerskovia sp. M15]
MGVAYIVAMALLAIGITVGRSLYLSAVPPDVLTPSAATALIDAVLVRCACRCARCSRSAWWSCSRRTSRAPAGRRSRCAAGSTGSCVPSVADMRETAGARRTRSRSGREAALGPDRTGPRRRADRPRLLALPERGTILTIALVAAVLVIAIQVVSAPARAATRVDPPEKASAAVGP